MIILNYFDQWSSYTQHNASTRQKTLNDKLERLILQVNNHEIYYEFVHPPRGSRIIFRIFE